MGPNIGPKPRPRDKMSALGLWGPCGRAEAGARAHFGPGPELGSNIWAHGPILPSVVAYWPVKSQIPKSVRSQIRSDQIKSDQITSNHLLLGIVECLNQLNH